MKFKVLLFLLYLLTACGHHEAVPTAPRLGYARLLTPLHAYTAGEPIVLEFQEAGFDAPLRLLLTNAFGNTVVKGNVMGDKTTYNVPGSFSRLAGECQWELLYLGRAVESGVLKIQPKDVQVPGLESYFGPRSLAAGDTDFSMLVTVPTDVYDNPMPDGTPTRVRTQFLDANNEVEVITKDFIAWNNIYSRPQAGRILVSAHCLESDSKELTTIVHPTLPDDFVIGMHRNHAYADGNQIIRFETSVIKDAYGNTIADGTLVTFMITDGTGSLLKTMGTSVNGRAVASMLHPSEPDEWKVTAYVTGAAQSNNLKVTFKAAIADFEVIRSADQRTVQVGPLLSFMQQKVPDGLVIRFVFFDAEGNEIEQGQTTSKNGMGSFKISKAFLAAGTYRMEVTAAGIVKNIQIQPK